MLYFKLTSFGVGIFLIAFALWALLDSKGWTDFQVQKVWREGNPVVIFSLFLIHLVLALIGWFLSLKVYRHPYAFLTAGFLTIGAIKLGGVLALYKTFRQAVVMLLTTEETFRIFFMAGALLLGSGMFYLGWIIR